MLPWRRGICSGQRVHLQNRRSRVRISPGCKVFRNLYIAVLLQKVNMYVLSLCVIEKKKVFY
jgi:hypothetical protein